MGLPLSVPRIGAYLAVLLAFLVRLVRLEDSPVWWDEGWSVWLARQDFLTIAQRTASDEHPPLHYWLLHLWTPLAGEDPFAVRFSSVVVGVLTVALLYRLGAELAHPGVGLLAAMLLAGSRFHVWWSQEIKMYGLAVFLALLSLTLFVRLLRTGRRRFVLSYLLVTLACLLTAYLGILVVAVQNGFLLAAILVGKAQWRIPLRGWLFLQTALAALFLPWMVYYLQHAHPYQRIGAFEPVQALHLYLTVLPLGISTDLDRYVPLALAFSGLALVGAAGPARRWRGRGWGPLPAESWLLPLVSILAVPLALLAFTLPEHAPYQPKVSERYMILFLPMYLLLLAYGLTWLWSWQRGLSVAVTALCGFVLALTLAQYLAARQPQYDTPALAYALRALYRPGDVVVLNPDKDWPVWAYHLPLAEASWLRVPHGARMSSPEADHWLRRLPPDAPAVWLISDPKAATTDPSREVHRWLSAHYPRVGARNFLRSRLTLFSRDPTRTLEQVAASKEQAGQSINALPSLALQQVGPLPQRLRAGQTAYLFTTWSATAPTARDYRARLVLRQDAGTAVARSWSPLLEERSAPWEQGSVLLARHTLSVPLSSAGGRYTVALEVEDAAQQRAAVPLGDLVIEPAKEVGADAAELAPAPAVLGNSVELAGYHLSEAAVRPGERFAVDLRWAVRTELLANYTVFVHLSSADDVVWATGDAIPGDGTLPTIAWSAGDSIDDTHTVAVPDITPPGTYTVYVGMYDPLSGQRLAAATPEGNAMPENRVALGTLTVEP